MAQSQLDHYLATLEARLKSLPPARRQEEMLEIRQHLEALVAGHLRAGVSEDAAVAAAIRQFGHAEQIGQELSKFAHAQSTNPALMRRSGKTNHRAARHAEELLWYALRSLRLCG